MSGLIPLPVAVPLLVAALLVGLGPFVRRRVLDAAAILTAAAMTVLTVVLLAKAAGRPLV
jgi:multicomponent Na+:H+ antiporter subunit D